MTDIEALRLTKALSDAMVEWDRAWIAAYYPDGFVEGTYDPARAPQQPTPEAQDRLYKAINAAYAAEDLLVEHLTLGVGD